MPATEACEAGKYMVVPRWAGGGGLKRGQVQGPRCALVTDRFENFLILFVIFVTLKTTFIQLHSIKKCLNLIGSHNVSHVLQKLVNQPLPSPPCLCLVKPKLINDVIVPCN